jgi:transposase-like protein
MVKEEERKRILAEVARLRETGKSISEAARLVDCTRATISRWLNEAGQGGHQFPGEISYTYDEKKSIIIDVAEQIADGVGRREAIALSGIDHKRFMKWLTSEPSLRVEFHIHCGKSPNVGNTPSSHSRKGFDFILEHIRDGKAIQRDGARWKVQLVDGALMRYELDGANTWRCKGFATFSGPDVLAKDWTIIDEV